MTYQGITQAQRQRAIDFDSAHGALIVELLESDYGGECFSGSSFRTFIVDHRFASLESLVAFKFLAPLLAARSDAITYRFSQLEVEDMCSYFQSQSIDSPSQDGSLHPKDGDRYSFQPLEASSHHTDPDDQSDDGATSPDKVTCMDQLRMTKSFITGLAIPSADPSTVTPHSFMKQGRRGLTLRTSSSPLVHSAQPQTGLGLLGMGGRAEEGRDDCALWLNTTDPFTAVICGIQSSGKSYTLNTMIESCMLTSPGITDGRGMITLVLNYDRSPLNVCESVGVAIGSQSSPHTVILTSPFNHKARSAFYTGLSDNVRVLPLVFPFKALDAGHLRTLMGLDDAQHPPLYANLIMQKLRDYQRRGVHPSWEAFKRVVEEEEFSKMQAQPLAQRVALLAGLVLESSVNKHIGELFDDTVEVINNIKPGTLVICDLTDPLLTADDANTVFSILTQMFIASQMKCPKVIVLDECHRYITSTKLTPLTRCVLTLVREMRHYGGRVLLSTQKPDDLPAQLLELCSLAVLHHMFSPVWASHLSAHLDVGLSPAELLGELSQCAQGDCLLFSPQSSSRLGDALDIAAGHCVRAHIRPRLTSDFGSSVVSTVPTASVVSE
eukprot:gnl/Dysnectes_brevis/6810_a10837_397.p1 GENE.gnl/Dysnectes_brevis/6810_a10837_397~~gnl/Dysnectes_brevis/6810_a10837_397.p1  ORF type:complete len:609 (-),score=137.99 gnl/Dysnectes_brevis/6810_a10837_397:74-1900(-)